MNLKPNTPLLTDVSQFEIDFVIPRVGVDLPLGIDPFLMFKSRDEALSKFHAFILQVFNHGAHLIQQKKTDAVRQLFLFPEVFEIGMGYTKKGKRGGGVGEYLAELIITSLADSPDLLVRGIKHIEELQLISLGIGPDRISDISANLIKKELIEYTQKQCELWDIPLTSNVPVQHIFNSSTGEWTDGYFDLPISPLDETPIILVPRRIVRTLPWINYDDFLRKEFSAYLRANKTRINLQKRKEGLGSISKESKIKIVSVTRREIERIDRYISLKEETAVKAQPSTTYIETDEICAEAEKLKLKLSAVRCGIKDAALFQRVVLEILNFLFNPELIDGELEVKTVDGTERRDIIFTNDSDQSFWDYIRTEHSSLIVMFETKNTSDTDNNHINQTATYLGERIGRLGFIVSRSALEPPQVKKTYSVYNDSSPKKIILNLSDNDLNFMLDKRCKGENPMRYIQKLYRNFRTSVQ